MADAPGVSGTLDGMAAFSLSFRRDARLDPAAARPVASETELRTALTDDLVELLTNVTAPRRRL
ncbi:MAG: hypothetical protein ABSG43_14000 [Solirubrobacteraceae bacterium]